MTITDEMRLIQGLSTWGLASVQPTSARGAANDDDDDTSEVDVDDMIDDFQEAA